MYSSFFGLGMAYRALSAQQAALDITGHNIANSNTPGYTRQMANIQAGTPLSLLSNGRQMSLGTGAVIDNVIRAKDFYIDRQLRWETSKYEYWSARKEALNIVEGLMNEPSEFSLHNDLDKFWNAWSELAKNPENMGARAVLQERANTLANTLNHIDQQVTDLQKDLDASIQVTVQQINTIAGQIKELNVQIRRAEVNGDSPNDLRDKRDALVDELSGYVPVRVAETKDHNFKDRDVSRYAVYIGDEGTPGNILVDDQKVQKLINPPLKDTNGFSRVIWQPENYDPANPPDPNDPNNWVELGDSMGRLQSNMEIRDTYLAGFRQSFDTLAQGIATAVNAVHATGQGLVAETTGLNFFTNGTGTYDPNIDLITAKNISINSAIRSDINRIATGKIEANVEVGDGSVANKIASLAQGWGSLETMGVTKPLEAASFGDYYVSIISRMGVEVQQSKRMAEGQAVLVNHMNNLRESTSGVSLDEEMANLIKFQKSYSAAARLVTMLDSMLERILGMGVTR